MHRCIRLCERGNSQTQLFYSINVDFHGKKRSNQIHHSRTDPEARAISEGKYQARLRMQSRQKTPQYSVSQRFRKKVEGCFSWIKTIGGLPRSHWPDRCKLEQQFTINASAYNSVRVNKRRPLLNRIGDAASRNSLAGERISQANSPTTTSSLTGNDKPDRILCSKRK